VVVSILSMTWSILCGASALFLALPARSQALAGFGLETLTDGAASGVLAWRFWLEGRDPTGAERLERIATAVLGTTLLLVATYLAGQATRSVLTGAGPERTLGGMTLSAISMGVLGALAYRKSGLARSLESSALRADAILSTAGALLALVALVSLALNAAFGVRWADAVAAYAIAAVLVREGLRVLRNRSTSSDGHRGDST